MNITLEQVARVLSRLNISFTASSTQKFIEKWNVKRVSRPNGCFNTTYNYVVDVESLKGCLVDDLGLDVNLVHSVLYGGNQ